jgi:hypothetical protein
MGAILEPLYIRTILVKRALIKRETCISTNLKLVAATSNDVIIGPSYPYCKQLHCGRNSGAALIVFHFNLI